MSYYWKLVYLFCISATSVVPFASTTKPCIAFWRNIYLWQMVLIYSELDLFSFNKGHLNTVLVFAA